MTSSKDNPLAWLQEQGLNNFSFTHKEGSESVRLWLHPQRRTIAMKYHLIKGSKQHLCPTCPAFTGKIKDTRCNGIDFRMLQSHAAEVTATQPFTDEQFAIILSLILCQPSNEYA